VPEAGACVNCPKRTGHNVLLFEGLAAQHDSCSDPKCYAAKVDAHVSQTIAAKPKLIQISTAYGPTKDGSAVVPRNKYVEIRSEKPTNPKQRDWPEYKTCKFTTEAIVTEGSEKGELRRLWKSFHKRFYAKFLIMRSAAQVWPLEPVASAVGESGRCA
jgi:ParB family chromosome partitioning protein